MLIVYGVLWGNNVTGRTVPETMAQGRHRVMVSIQSGPAAVTGVAMLDNVTVVSA